MATTTYTGRLELRTQAQRLRVWLIEGSLSLCVCTHIGVASNGYAQDSLSEYQVKAAYLFNFLKFEEWPEEPFADRPAPIVIGIIADDPFGDALPHVVLGKTVQGRDLVIRKYRAGEDLRGSHILIYQRVREEMASPNPFQSARVMRVDCSGRRRVSRREGGMIQLFSEGNHVRFTNNVDAAVRAKLKLSSKLLNPKRVVGCNGKEGGF
jgi:hypothetical protein